MPFPAVRRSDTDACPGALRLHTAADGPLARVRLPGGLLTGAQLAVVRSLAERWGDGHAELTSRANLQLRALTGATTADLAGPLRAAGLLPSDTHELVRNIAASPLHARDDVRALDRALCADPRLAGLPGRFLFAFDAGHGDVYGGADVTAMPAGVLLLAGTDVGLRVPSPDVVPAMLAAAHAFLDERAAQGSTAWRLAELTDGPARVAARLASLPSAAAAAPAVPPAGPASVRPALASLAPDEPASPGLASAGSASAELFGTLALGRVAPMALPPSRPRPPIGVVAQPDGLVAAGAAVPLGRLDGTAMAALAQAARLVITPWRGVVVPGLRGPEADAWLRTLAGAGLAVTTDSRWAAVTACAGRPGCAKSLADVRADARAATLPGDGLPVHWVGCARGCGSPSGTHVRVEATGPRDYDVTAPRLRGRATTTDVGALVATARRS